MRGGACPTLACNGWDISAVGSGQNGSMGKKELTVAILPREFPYLLENCGEV